MYQAPFLFSNPVLQKAVIFLFAGFPSAPNRDIILTTGARLVLSVNFVILSARSRWTWNDGRTWTNERQKLVCPHNYSRVVKLSRNTSRAIYLNPFDEPPWKDVVVLLRDDVHRDVDARLDPVNRERKSSHENLSAPRELPEDEGGRGQAAENEMKPENLSYGAEFLHGSQIFATVPARVIYLNSQRTSRGHPPWKYSRAVRKVCRGNPGVNLSNE